MRSVDRSHWATWWMTLILCATICASASRAQTSAGDPYQPYRDLVADWTEYLSEVWIPNYFPFAMAGYAEWPIEEASPTRPLRILYSSWIGRNVTCLVTVHHFGDAVRIVGTVRRAGEDPRYGRFANPDADIAGAVYSEVLATEERMIFGTSAVEAIDELERRLRQSIEAEESRARPLPDNPFKDAWLVEYWTESGVVVLGHAFPPCDPAYGGMAELFMTLVGQSVSEVRSWAGQIVELCPDGWTPKYRE